jgi:alanine-glyoxylate transaminase / serine-glyoxylate transaminase / serine-pyruvate transaminase
VDTLYGELNVPARILMGPGPSMVHPRVLRAMATPMVGHLDPVFLQIMDETMDLLRRVFQTGNAMTFPVPGTGTAGMEACLANLLEPGDRAVVVVNGYFGERLCEMAARHGAEVARVDVPWGRAVDPAAVEAALTAGRTKLVAAVHAETSTGVRQPAEPLAAACRRHGALLVMDAVTSLGASPVAVDAWGADAAYSCTQKGLSCPPGLAPVTFNERATASMRARQTPAQTWYLDVSLLGRYWTPERLYHHTAPITMYYALREGLRLVLEEGLEARWQRTEAMSRALAAGLEALGLALFADPGCRLASLTTVQVPHGISEAEVRKALLAEFNLEIGGGLGPVKGKVWRIGLLGESATRANVLLLLSALESVLARQGVRCAPGAGVAAAQMSFAAGA